MSVCSWYVLIVKLLEQAKIGRQGPFRFMAQAGLDAATKHAALMDHVDLNDWIAMSNRRSLERIQRIMQRGHSDQASIDKVAGPVGEALIMTAIGLAVAVPAVLAYNWLVGRNRDAMADIRAFASDLHAAILGSVKKT